MKQYTTVQVAKIVGDISADAIRKFANKNLIEGVDFQRFGRTIVINESGLDKIKNRNTKPGPQSNRSNA